MGPASAAHSSFTHALIKVHLILTVLPECSQTKGVALCHGSQLVN